jgi:hypothetical protein
MFHDIQNQLLNKAAATGLSTDVWDTGKVGGSDISIGEPLSGLVVPVTIGTAGTLTVDIIQSATSNMAAPDIIATHTFTLATSDIDKQLEVVLAQGVISKQFLAFSFSGTAVLTASAYLVPCDQVAVNKFFPKVYPSI